jgi:hypothetical protein
MSDTVKNVPRGVRPGFTQRPELEEDAWEKIQREQEKMKEREFVRFSVLKVDTAWRRLPPEVRDHHKAELEHTVGEWGREMMVYSYCLVGTRGDADFLLWQASRKLEQLHQFQAAVNRTGLGGYLSFAHSYFAMTKRSIYLNRYEEDYIKRYGGTGCSTPRASRSIRRAPSTSSYTRWRRRARGTSCPTRTGSG